MNARLRTLIWTLALAGALCRCGSALADAGDDQYAVAASHYTAKRWDLAVTEFQTLLEKYPSNARTSDARFYLGESLLQLHRYRDAAQQFAKASTDQTPKTLARLALYRQGESLYLAGDAKTAEPVLRQFVEKFPDDPLLDHTLPYQGMCALRLDQPAEAEKLFERSLAAHPAGPLADLCRLGRAEASENLHQPDEAAARYQKLLESPTKTTANLARLRLGILKYRATNYLDAAAVLKPLAADVNMPELRNEARYWLGMSYLNAGDPRQALDVFLPLAAQNGPRSDEIRLRCGMALQAVGRPADAKAKFQQVTEKSTWAAEALWGQIQVAVTESNDAELDRLCNRFHERHAEHALAPQVTETIARRMTQRQDYDRAIEFLTKQVAGHSSDDESVQRFRYLLAVANVGRQRYEPALVQLNLVVSAKDPELRARGLASQGAVLVALGRYDEAVAPLSACLKLRPEGSESVACQGQLAICLARTGKIEQAREIDTAIEARKIQDASRKNVTLALAEAALAGGDAKWAGILFNRLAEAKDTPADLRTQALLGITRAQIANGNNSEAAATLDKLQAARSTAPLPAESLFALGQALEKMGRPDDALKAYRDLIKTYPRHAQLSSAMFRAANVCEGKRDKTEALKLYDQLVTEHGSAPEVEPALYQSAWMLSETGRKQESLDRFRALHDKHAKSRYWPDATYRLAAAALDNKQYDEVQRLVAELIAANPRPQLLAHALYLDGQRAVAQQKWSEADASLSQLLEKAPQSKLCLSAEFWLAESAYRQEHLDDARKKFDALGDKIAGRKDAWLATVPLRRAQLAALNKDWKATRQRIEEIRETWPDFGQSYEVDYLDGRCLVAAARLGEARRAYRRVTESTAGGKSETAAMAQWMIGESYLHQEQYEKALREYLRVEALYAYPRWQAASLLQAGKCYENLNRWNDAAELYQRIIKQYSETTFRDEAQQRLHAAEKRLAEKPVEEKRS